MLGHGFSGTKSAGNGGGASLCYGEHGVYNSLARNKRNFASVAPLNRPRHANGPFLAKGKVMHVTLFVLNFCNNVVNFIFAVGRNKNNLTRKRRGKHNFMNNRGGFGTFGVNIAARKLVSDRNFHAYRPSLLLVEGANRASSADKSAGVLLQNGQRAFNSVENIAYNTGAEGDRHGVTGRINRLAAFKPRRNLINLNNGAAFAYFNNLAYKLFLADKHHFLHKKVACVFNRYNRTVYAVNNIVVFSHFKINSLNFNLVILAKGFLFLFKTGVKGVVGYNVAAFCHNSADNNSVVGLNGAAGSLFDFFGVG